MQNVVIVATTRTVTGSFQSSLAGIPAPELGTAVIHRLLEQIGLDAGRADEVILDQVLIADPEQNPACQAMIRIDLPVGMPAMALNKVCGSGLKAPHLGARTIRCDGAEVVITGSQENMSLASYIMPGARTGLRMGYAKLVNSMIKNGLWDAFNNYHISITAEDLAGKYGPTCEKQDVFAATSQQKTTATIEGKHLRDGITPIQVPQHRNEPLSFGTDEQPHAGTTVEILTKLKSAFRKGGNVTTDNIPGLNDGTAMVLLVSVVETKTLGLPMLARIASYTSAGADPTIMGIGLVSAARRALDKTGWSLKQLDLIEVSETFAVQSLAVGRELDWDTTRINVDGDAVALGHPIGASGYQVLVTLLYEMIRRDVKRGLAALCTGGGQGVTLTLAYD